MFINTRYLEFRELFYGSKFYIERWGNASFVVERFALLKVVSYFDLVNFKCLLHETSIHVFPNHQLKLTSIWINFPFI